MAETRLEKSEIESAISNVSKYSNSICSHLTELYSIVSNVKEYYQSNGNVVVFLDNLADTLKSVTNDYGTYRDDFLKTLQDIISTYELEDSRTSMSISQLDGKTIASMSIGAGAFSAGASGFDFGKISLNANDAANGNFVDESKVHNSAFCEGEYTFQYRKDGSVRIDRNGVPLGFTTKENADKITGGVNTGTTNSAMKNDPRYQYNKEEDGSIGDTAKATQQLSNSENKINAEASKHNAGTTKSGISGEGNSSLGNANVQQSQTSQGGLAGIPEEVLNAAGVTGDSTIVSTGGTIPGEGNSSLGNANVQQSQTSQGGLAGIPEEVLNAAGVTGDSTIVSTGGTIPAFEKVFEVNEKMMGQASNDKQ